MLQSGRSLQLGHASQVLPCPNKSLYAASARDGGAMPAAGGSQASKAIWIVCVWGGAYKCMVGHLLQQAWS